MREEILQKLSDIPSPSPVLHRILELRRAKEVEYDELEDIVKTDPALTVRFLRIANGVEVRRNSSEIHSIRRAIMAIGMKRTTNIVTLHALDSLQTRNMPGYDMAEQGMWRFSLRCAEAMRALGALDTTAQESVDLYTSGLVLNIGKLALGPYLGQVLDQVMAVMHEREITFDQAEAIVLGIDHAELGAALARHWKLPEEFVHTIRYHHRPHEATESVRLAYLGHMAEMIAAMLGESNSVDTLHYQCVDGWRHHIPLDDQTFHLVLLDVEERVQHTMEMLHV